jgi:uncharacterized lipoprotein YajG
MKLNIYLAAVAILLLAGCAKGPTWGPDDNQSPAANSQAPNVPTTIYVETPDDSKASTAGASTTTNATIRVPASTGSAMGR